jgi:ankyrin repeat protein
MGFDPTEITLASGEFPPLYEALMYDRDFEEAAKLISAGARLDDLIEVGGYSLLHVAAEEGDQEMVDFFLDHDCPQTLKQFDEIQMTPLIRAAQHGQTDIVVRLLAARVDPNANDEENIGNTAIREAVREGHADVVEILLRAGADPTIPGWVNISAVDQAWDNIRADRETMRKIRGMLKGFPSRVRERIYEQNKTLDADA